MNTFLADDKKNIAYYYWLPSDGQAPKGIVQIAHGMAEHAARYDRFAQFLTANGFAVYANDHRGHGNTAGDLEQVGYIEEGHFWEKTIGDMKVFLDLIKSKHPGKPVFFLGHSMGSLLGRDFISKYGNEFKGVIFSGTGGDPGFLGKVGLFLARIEAFFRGRKKPSSMLNNLSFGKFNQFFKPNRTEFDWLSRDQEEVDKYVSDPLCGTVFTTGFFIDLLEGIRRINNAVTYAATPKELPIVLMAGDRDPVGDMGKGVQQVYASYQQAGMQNTTIKLYENARHEILNETNREEVFRDILAFLEKQV